MKNQRYEKKIKDTRKQLTESTSGIWGNTYFRMSLIQVVELTNFNSFVSKISKTDCIHLKTL